MNRSIKYSVFCADSFMALCLPLEPIYALVSFLSVPSIIMITRTLWFPRNDSFLLFRLSR